MLERRKAIREEWESTPVEERSFTTIALKHGVSVGTVRNSLGDALKRRCPFKKEKLQKSIAEACLPGVTTNDLMKKFDKSRPYVLEALKKHGKTPARKKNVGPQPKINQFQIYVELKQGKDPTIIADEHKISPEWVHRIRKKAESAGLTI